MRAMQIIGLLLGLLALGVIAAIGWGTYRHTGLTHTLVTRLEAAQRPVPAYDTKAADIAALPAPVQRYLKAVLPETGAAIAGVTLMQTGTFNTSETGQKWQPFTARHQVMTQRPGFVWDARIVMFPGLQTYVHDAYVDGDGLLRATLAGLLTLTDLRGPGDIAQGELMRFLAEAPWYPTALLPGQGVVWKAVAPNEADATLTDGAVSVTLRFRFGDDGMVESVRADARGRMVNGMNVPTPWEGRWSSYQQRGNFRVPMTGEVAWILPEGRKPYWRGTVYAIEYQPR